MVVCVTSQREKENSSAKDGEVDREGYQLPTGNQSAEIFY